jgi:hypothetical protein
VSWSLLAKSDPELAAAGARLLKGDATAVAYLATVRKDGGPRVHPVMPVLCEGGLYVFVVSLGWKYRDLLRDPRYSLHSSPSAKDGEEFYVTGRAVPVEDPAVRGSVRTGTGNRLGGHDFEALFELTIERALHTRWAGWGTPQTWPEYHKWAPPAGL